MATLALSAWITTATIITLVSLTALVLIVWAPWREVRDEPPLDETVETRILLGDDPSAIAHDQEDKRKDAPRRDQRPSRPHLSGPAA